MKRKFYTKEEDNIIKRCFGRVPVNKLLELLPDRAHGSIKQRARRLKIRIGPGNNPASHATLDQTKYMLDENFFSTPAPLNCYWAGFISADGNIRHNRVKVALSSKDHDHLTKLKHDLKFTGPVNRYKEMYRGNDYWRSNLTFSSPQIVSDLANIFNITERKSLTLTPPNLVLPEHIYSYIIGYIDGDGCIGITQDTKGIPYVYLDITSGSPKLLEWINLHLGNIIGNDKNRVYSKNNSNALSYRISHSNATKILLFLNQFDVPKLERKWKIVQDLTYPKPGYTSVGIRKKNYHPRKKGYIWCSKCQRLLEPEKFNKNKSTKNGYQSYCRKCFKEYREEAA